MICGLDDNNSCFEYRKTLYAAIIGADQAQQRDAYNLGLVGYAVRDLSELSFMSSFAVHPPGKADFICAILGALYHTFGQFNVEPDTSAFPGLYPAFKNTIIAVILVATDNYTNDTDHNLAVSLALRLFWVRAEVIASDGVLTDVLAFIQGSLHIDCIDVQIFALRALIILIDAGRFYIKRDTQRRDIVRDIVRRIIHEHKSAADVTDSTEWEQLRDSLMEGTARLGVFWGAMSEGV